MTYLRLVRDPESVFKVMMMFKINAYKAETYVFMMEYYEEFVQDFK